jgi:16S rRNA C1402 (ribose-2'-O) methylase RsmI
MRLLTPSSTFVKHHIRFSTLIAHHIRFSTLISHHIRFSTLIAHHIRFSTLITPHESPSLPSLPLQDVESTPQPQPLPLEKSTLYIVSTPIGALRDITLRALDVLNDADAILCEDSRVTRKLLTAHGIVEEGRRIPLISRATAEVAIGRLRLGESLALVSDAGTPAISDPCSQIVADVVAAGFKVRSVPGASSLLSALAVSGFDIHRHYSSGRSYSDVRSIQERRRLRAKKAGFIVENEIDTDVDVNTNTADGNNSMNSSEGFIYYGFLPPKGEERNKILNEVSSSSVLATKTIVFFENGKRLCKLLKDLQTKHGLEGVTRKVLICRELTKRYEQHMRFATFREAITFYESTNEEAILLGEFVILLGATSKEKETTTSNTIN